MLWYIMKVRGGHTVKGKNKIDWHGENYETHMNIWGNGKSWNLESRDFEKKIKLFASC